jgi:hypothetical protein
MAMIDKRAPVTSERIESMRRLSSRGVSTSLRFRPILPGISDSTPKYPKAYKTLIDMAADAGARAISYEVGFTPGRRTDDIERRWREIERIAGLPLLQIYDKFGKQACTRPSYAWTENIMHAIKEEAVKRGMTVGVSDPVWKQLSDVGCCCGIEPDDPVFGNWEPENATNALINAKQTGDKIYFKDICPPWAADTPMSWLCNMGVGAETVYKARYMTWQDKLRKDWNNLKLERSPLNYFQGAMMPVSRDANGDIVYEYKGLERKNPVKIPYWDV